MDVVMRPCELSPKYGKICAAENLNSTVIYFKITFNFNLKK